MPNPPKLFTVGSESLTLNQWSQRHGVPAGTIDSRIRLGWPVADAVRAPVDRRFRPTTRAPKGTTRPTPKLRTHAGSGQAYCEWQSNGERFTRYFGKAGTEAAEDAYKRFQLEWATRLVRRAPAVGEAVLVCELVEAWLDYCEHGDDGEGGCIKRGKLTSAIYAHRSAANYLLEAHGTGSVDAFTPDDLRAVRKGMIDAKLSRTTINGYQTGIVQMFGWGVGRQLVPADVCDRLKHVGLLQKGKTSAPERKKKPAIPWANVEAVFPHLHANESRRAVLETLIRVHWLLGGRPNDLVSMRVGHIDRTGDVWRYAVEGHKNEHREQELAYYIGPKCQAILVPLLEGRSATDLVFAYPPLSERGKRCAISRARYGIQVKGACKAAGVKLWTPHQLRHSRATEVMRVYESNEAAAAVIGDTPEVARTVYVDPLDAVRRRIAKETG
jgi:integrase